jgi:hypothetical protein
MRTNNHPPRTATLLTLLIVLLLPVATATGLFMSGFYRDTTWMIPQARGQDLVTLIVVEPLLIGALIGAQRKRVAALLLWMGALGYVLYTYAMYSYTTYFNALFLVYVGLFSTSLFALIDLLVHLDLTQIRAAIRPTMPARVVAAFCALVGAFFLAAWLGQIVPATLQGTVPEPLLLAKTPTSAVHVQDLAVVLPLFFAAAVWLWQRRLWGFVLGALLLVVADVMLLALLAMGFFSAQAGIVGALDMAPVFTILAVVSLSVTALFFAHIQRPAVTGSPDGADSQRDAATARVAPSAVLRPDQATQAPEVSGAARM